MSKPYIDDPNLRSIPEEDDHADQVVADEQGTSLAARVAARRRELEAERTVIIEVPGWAGVLAVEMRLMGWDEMRKIAIRHQKVKPIATQEFQVMCDTVVQATERFHEVLQDGAMEPREGYTWLTLAQQTVPVDEIPDGMNPRIALIKLLGDNRIPTLYRDYMTWNGGDERVEVDQEVEQDFGGTG